MLFFPRRFRQREAEAEAGAEAEAEAEAEGGKDKAIKCQREIQLD